MRNVISRSKFSYNLGPQVQAAPLAEPAPPPVVQAPAQPQANRHMRRKNKTFNKRLSRRLAKDKLPAKVEILPDGGIHVTVDTREEKPGAPEG